MSKKERTKNFIIEKTASIFNRKGYSGTSLSEIMEVTGLTKGCIYGNFENKDQIALAAFDYNFGLVNTFIRKKILDQENAIDKLLVYSDTYRDFLTKPFIIEGCPILNTAMEADDTHPLLRNKAIAALKYWQQGIEKIIANGIENNEIRPDVNGKEVSIVLTSLVEGGVMQAKLIGKSDEIKITMSFLENMIKGLRA